MSEHLKNHESHEDLGIAESAELHSHNTHEKELKNHHESMPSIDQIRDSIEQEQQKHDKQPLSAETNIQNEVPDLAISHQVKAISLDRTLRKLQRQMSSPERVLSKVVHQPTVDRISEFSSKTVARPSGILSGGVFAFLGSFIFLYISKHYGYKYNYLLFALFFVGGFILGLIIELLLFIVRTRHNKKHIV